MILQKEKVDHSFPAEATTWNKREMVELMPPVLDEKTGIITYFCAICQEQKTATADQPIGYFIRPEQTLQRAAGYSGNVCPDCEAKGGY